MKFTFNWLKEFVEITLRPADLAKSLTMAGLEVESLTVIHEPEGAQEDWLFEVGAPVEALVCFPVTRIAERDAVSRLKLGRRY